MILLQLGGQRAELLRYATNAERAQRRSVMGEPAGRRKRADGRASGRARRACRGASRACSPIRPKSRDIAKPTPGDRGLRPAAGAASEAQARQILERLLIRLDGIAHKGADQLAARAMALAALGRRDEAIAELRASGAGPGWRLADRLRLFRPRGRLPVHGRGGAAMPRFQPAGRRRSRPTMRGCASTI